MSQRDLELSPIDDELETGDDDADLSAEPARNMPQALASEDEPVETNGDDSADGAVTHRIRIRRRVPGRRLDKYLHGRYSRVSRTMLQRWIREGTVTVNGMPVKPSYEPQQNDRIEIEMPPPPPNELVPEDIPIDVIYEDEWLIAINKQAGIVCHPARATQSGTIANAVAYYAGTLSRSDDPFRPGIIHRLDKNTTGVMLIAKSDEAHWRVSLQFERRTVKKQYFAVCQGRVALDGDLIDKPLAPHPETTQRMILQDTFPPRQAMFKEAVTQYEVEKRYRGFTTVNLFPRTGRTHQLRVHMMSIGNPIVGDKLYGGPYVSERDLCGEGSDVPLIEYQALHARRLELMHPILEKPIRIEAPLPRQIRELVEMLEKHRSA